MNRIGNDCKEKIIKLLGIYTDESISWKKPIDHVNSKMSRTLHSISQAKHLFPCSSLNSLYYAIIHPHISHGLLAWGNALPSLFRKIEILQKIAIRTINKKKTYNTPTDPLFRSSRILKLKNLYEYQVNIFMYDVFHKLLPKSFDLVIKYNHEIQTRPSRQSHLLHVDRCRTKFVENLPLNVFPKISNKYIKYVTDTETRPRFKKQIQDYLIKAYPNIVKCTNTHCKDCRQK